MFPTPLSFDSRSLAVFSTPLFDLKSLPVFLNPSSFDSRSFAVFSTALSSLEVFLTPLSFLAVYSVSFRPFRCFAGPACLCSTISENLLYERMLRHRSALTKKQFVVHRKKKNRTHTALRLQKLKTKKSKDLLLWIAALTW